MPDVHWIEAPIRERVGTLPRPRGGDWLADDLRRIREAGATVLVSLLERAETVELELAEEAALAAEQGLRFFGFPIPDRGVPESRAEFAAFVRDLAALARGGEALAIHCRAGIGRASLTAVSVLGLLGIPPEPAFALVSAARGLEVPDTREQVEWVETFLALEDSR